MARFVDCDGGWINLDLICRVREQRRQNGFPTWTFESAHGEVIGRQSFPSDTLDEVIAPIITSAPGAEAVAITPCSDGGGSSRPARVYTQRVPIVGWRIAFGGAVPILVQAPMPGDTILVVLSDGKLLAPGEATFDTLEEAEASILRWAQGDWDRANQHQRKVA